MILGPTTILQTFPKNNTWLVAAEETNVTTRFPGKFNGLLVDALHSDPNKILHPF